MNHDQRLNLRETLRGPKGLTDSDCWTFNYTKRVGEQETQKSCKFSNLGMALLVASEKSKDSQVRAVLAMLLQSDYFLPDARDFESLITVWRDLGSTLVMKPFIQSGPMQLLFNSYNYDAKRRITRLLLGLSPDQQET